MSTALRRVRIMAGEPGPLSGAHVRLRTVLRPGPPRVLRLIQPAVAGVAAVAAAAAGEV